MNLPVVIMEKRKNIKLVFKNVYTKTALKLIDIFFKQYDSIDIKDLNLTFISIDYNSKQINTKKIISLFKEIDIEISLNGDDVLISKIKMAAIELIQYRENVNSIIRNSDYISDKLQLPYDKISRIFSKNTNTTLEKYILFLKIEKIKKLIIQDNYTLSEITYMMEYSSVQYLSKLFKTHVGVTFSEYKVNPDKYSNKELI